jgi:hypothetical protein
VLFVTGTTFIGHNSEAATNVSHCTEPGCYTRSISYEASSRQIAALSQISADCRQTIKVHILINCRCLMIFIYFYNNHSTNVIRPHWNLKESNIPGGTTETENRNTTGTVVITPPIRVSVGSAINASITPKNTTVTPWFPPI